MRLKKIKIINFGQLSNVSFDLPSNKLNVFFGANEAGKSTTVAFIKQVMFGFYLRSNSSPFFEDYKPLAHVSPMGGSLFFEDEQGAEFELERLWAKGDQTKRGILTVKKDGQVVPESLFFDQIQNIDGNFYTDSFIFNQEMLGQVASLSQQNLLERIYYLGAADSGKLLNLRDAFSKEADNLFKKTGKKPLVNQLLKQVDEQERQYQETQSQFADYQELAQAKIKDEEQLKQVQTKLASLQKQKSKLNQLKEQLKNFAQLKELQKQAKDVQFNQQNYQKAQELVAKIQNLQETIASLTKQAETIKQTKGQDFSTERKLVQKKSEVLEWRTQYNNCQKKAKQLQTEKEQLFTVYPNLQQTINLSNKQIDELQQDYQKLPQEEPKIPQPTNNKTLLIIGAILIVLGVILAIPKGWVGLILLVIGLGLAFYAYSQDKSRIALINQAKAKQKQYDQAYTAFKNKFGLNAHDLNMPEILNAQAQYQLKVQAEADNQEEIATVNKEFMQLKQLVGQRLGQEIANNFAALLDALDQLDENIDQNRHQQDRLNNLKINLSDNQDNLEKINLELKAVLAKDNVARMTEYDQRYQESLAQAKINTQIAALKENLGSRLDQLEQLNKEPEKFTAKMTKLEEEINNANQAMHELQNLVAQKQVQLEQLADSTTVFEAKQQLANTQTQLRKASQEYLANLLAAKWIDRTLDIASNERFPKMLQSARSYLKILTGGRYVDLELAKKISVIRFDGKKREVKYLSRGTAEQLYFALKLAFIEQIKDQINLPILIDDSFVNFDDQRVDYIEELLNKISANNQVLIFTAQKNLVDHLKVQPLKFRKDSNHA